VDALPHLDLARVRHDRAVLVDPDVRKHRVACFLGRKAAGDRLGRRDKRIRITVRRECSGGLVNRGPDAWIGAAAAQVAAHPLVDLRVVGRRV
jgi:hypothetical protein